MIRSVYMRFLEAQRVELLLRLTLYGGEVYKAPRACMAVRVRTGVAWVTHGGADIILPAGNHADLTPSRDFALISSLGSGPLVVELLGNARSLPHRVSGAALSPACDRLPETTGGLAR